MIAPLLLCVLAVAGNPRRPPPASAELRDLTAAIDGSPAEFTEAAHRINAARLRHATEKLRILADEVDTVARLQKLAEEPSLGLMSHEQRRLQAERTRLAEELQEATVEVLAQHSRLGPELAAEAQAPWADRTLRDEKLLRDAARARALPGARDAAEARLDAELAHLARAQRRLIALQDDVLPDMQEALDAAILDLPRGGNLFDVLEALERTTAIRLTVADLKLEREVARVRLELLAGPSSG